MSGRTTTPTRACTAGRAYAAENRLPSAAVRVRPARSPTAAVRGGAGGRLSWSWHTAPVLPPGAVPRAAGRSVAGHLAGGLRTAAEDRRGDLATRLGQPLVLS